MKTSRCRSCEAEIIWTETTKGRKMPVDAEPATDRQAKMLFVLSGEDPPLAMYAMPIDRAGDEPLYASHFSTCPNADQHRKGREAETAPVVQCPKCKHKFVGRPA